LERAAAAVRQAHHDVVAGAIDFALEPERPPLADEACPRVA